MSNAPTTADAAVDPKAAAFALLDIGTKLPTDAQPTTTTYQRSGEIDVGPSKPSMPGVKGFDHGTYNSHPYYAFVPDPDQPDSTLLISDLGFRAQVTYIDGTYADSNKSGNPAAKFTLTPVGPLAAQLSSYTNIVLSWNDDVMGAHSIGFVISGTAEDCALLKSSPTDYLEDSDNFYIERLPNDPDEAKSNSQTWNDNFTNKNYGLSNLLRAFNIKVMDLDDLQALKSDAAAADPDLQHIAADKQIFALPAPGSKNYSSVGAGAATPWGWSYKAYTKAEGGEHSRMLSTSADVMNSSMRASGFNVKVSANVKAGPVKASASFSRSKNKSIEKKIRNITKAETVTTEIKEVQLDFVMVLDKKNVPLSRDVGDKPGFRKRVAQLASDVEGKTPDEINARLDHFFDEWGTHFVNAATFGVMKLSTESITKSDVTKMKANGVTLKKAWDASASVDVEGPGVGGGASVEGGQQHENQTEAEQTTQKIAEKIAKSWVSTGEGDHRPPIYVDLRPISELLGPPLFADSLITVTLRDLVASRLDTYGFINDDEADIQAKQPPMVAFELDVKLESENYDFWDGTKKDYLKKWSDTSHLEGTDANIIVRQGVVIDRPMGGDNHLQPQPLYLFDPHIAATQEVIGLAGGSGTITVLLDSSTQVIDLRFYLFANDSADALWPGYPRTCLGQATGDHGHWGPKFSEIPFFDIVPIGEPAFSPDPSTPIQLNWSGNVFFNPRKEPGSNDAVEHGFGGTYTVAMSITSRAVPLEDLIGLPGIDLT